MLINKLQSDILEYLGGWFGFLTCSQIMLLTGKRSAGYVREMLGRLRRHGYIQSFRIEVSHKVRSENMYSITPLGVELIQSHKGIFRTVKSPIAPPLLVRDFYHRFNTVLVEVLLYKHFTAHNTPIETLLSYFDKQGSSKRKNLIAQTAVKIDGHGTYIPDFVIKTPSMLMLGEVFCDRNSKRIIDSLAVHAKGLNAGSASKAFDFNGNATIVSVFEHKGIKEAVIKKLQQYKGFQPMSKLFFFATIDEVKNNCATAWHTIDNEPLLLR